MKNIRLIVDNDRKAKQPYFIKKELQTILKAKKIHRNNRRSAYTIKINNKNVFIDIRYLNDGYYDDAVAKSESQSIAIGFFRSVRKFFFDSAYRTHFLMKKLCPKHKNRFK